MTKEEKESSDSLRLSFTQERTPKKYNDKLEERKPREFSPREGNFAPRSRPESNFNDRKPRDFAPRREGSRDSFKRKDYTPRPRSEVVSEEQRAEDFFNS